jgi:hypothetical protein
VAGEENLKKRTLKSKNAHQVAGGREDLITQQKRKPSLLCGTNHAAGLRHAQQQSAIMPQRVATMEAMRLAKAET